MLLDDSNIAENYSGVSSPLTCSLAEETYRLIFTRLGERFLGPARMAADGGYARDIAEHMAVAYRGHLYYRLDNWLRMLQMLPLSGRIIPLWRRSLGVPEAPLPPRPAVGWRARYGVAWRLAGVWRATPRLMAGLDRDVADVQRAYDGQAMTDQVVEQASNASGVETTGTTETSATPVRPQCPTSTGAHPGAEIGALRDLYVRLRDGVFRNWDVTLVNDLRAFVYTALATRTGAPVHGVALESLKPIRALAALRLHPECADLASLGTDEAVRDYLSTGSPLAAALRTYIEQYGDRGPGELKLESQTFRTHPLALVKTVLAAPGGSAGVPSVAAPMSATPPPPPRNPFARRALAAIAGREASRLNRSRLYGMMRSIAWRAGTVLESAELLETPGDVFYLTLDELFATPADRRRLVAARRAEWAQYAAEPPPSRLDLPDPTPTVIPAKAGTPDPTPTVIPAKAGTPGAHRRDPTPTPPRNPGPTPDTLRGTPASPGYGEGEVLVVTEPGIDAAGKIVVAVSTDPGWVFLLSTAAGVITERGSPLSHTAIVCRELGLPAVVAVPGATTRLRDGDRVRLDATAGEIEVVRARV